MTCQPAPWREIEERLRPFVARRVAGPDVDDVLQDVYVRMQRGLANLRDDDSFTSWLFQVARSAIAEHGRGVSRHPVADGDAPDDASPDNDDGDREAARNLSGCVADFVARLPSPYREAVTLVELQGLTAREAAELSGISASGMKSRVRRGRAQLRGLFEECCAIALDARNKVVDYAPHDRCGC
jgi:RNA polymerase sigma-70 factor (ECF subfamily)